MTTPDLGPARERLVDLWESAAASFLNGESGALPAPLDMWRQGYNSRGRGAVAEDAFAEPYLCEPSALAGLEELAKLASLDVVARVHVVNPLGCGGDAVGSPRSFW